MPFVDLKTGRIFGCKRYSFSWHHERGHIIFNNSKQGMFIDFWKGNVFIWMVFTLGLNILFGWFYFKLLLLLLMVVYSCFYLYEEVWCHKYAIQILLRKVTKKHSKIMLKR